MNKKNEASEYQAQFALQNVSNRAIFSAYDLEKATKTNITRKDSIAIY